MNIKKISYINELENKTKLTKITYVNAANRATFLQLPEKSVLLLMMLMNHCGFFESSLQFDLYQF